MSEGLKLEHVCIHTSREERYPLIKREDGYVIDTQGKASNKTGFVTWKDHVLEIHVSIEQTPYDYMESFQADQAVEIEMRADDADEVLASELYSPFWCRPFFTKELSQLPEHTQALLIHRGMNYIFILPICNEVFRCDLSGATENGRFSVNVSKQCGGYTKLCGSAAVIVSGTKPYDTIQKGYQIAIDRKLLNTKLRVEKKYPEMFDYLGWCTWNACYHEVSAKQVLHKAEEFLQKSIPVRWMLMDDGWSPAAFKRVRGVDKKIPDTLLDLCEDREKFPDGIRSMTDRLKEEYGIKWFGIWHSFTGYWCGLKDKSSFEQECQAAVCRTNSGYLLPSPHGSYPFFHKWHTYLKESGIDFLKTDTQGNLAEYFKYMQDSCGMVAEVYAGFRRSAKELFADSVINCMALSGMSMYNGGDTPLTRSSDDFYPEKEHGFMFHAIQNAYNSVFVSPLFYCDYDMWWSRHNSAVQSGMLRAVSGGPVYLSDKLGESELASILPLIEADGRILRCDAVGLPTEDCLFTDLFRKEKILKIFNHKGEEGVVALFNLGEEALETTVSVDDFNGTGQYVAYAYSQKRFYMEGRFTIRLTGGSSEIVNFYRVKDGTVFLGDLSKYVSIACREKNAVSISELPSSHMTVTGLEQDPLAHYTIREERVGHAVKVTVTIENKGEADIEKRIALCTGIDCYMDTFPEWNEKYFPTMMRCENTHFYGYCMTPSGKLLGVACPEGIASHQLLYNGRGHRIHSVALDLVNPLSRPKRYPQKLCALEAGKTMERSIYFFTAKELSELYGLWEYYTGAPMIASKKWIYEIGESLQITVSEGANMTIRDPSGREITNHSTLTEYGIYQVNAEKNGKRSEALIYCRKSWNFYLREARRQAILKPQKATTHCESWYGLFSGYLAAKYEPDLGADREIEKKFQEIASYTFDFERGEPLLLPERIQNTSTMISLLVDRYEATGDRRSLDDADRLSNFLIARQHRDGAYYRDNRQHYTCVIYIAKSILELYLAERKFPEYSVRASKHFDSAKRAVDNLVKQLDKIGTEGEQTFEDGMIACCALQIGMFALFLDASERETYVKAAETMMKKHRCLEQQLIPDCRMRCASLRYWEAQYDILTKPNMMDSPHGWTAWTLYAYYYLYLLTGKPEYLMNLMDGMGACVQLMTLDGNLRWAFICDPCIEAEVFVKDRKAEHGYSGKTEKKVIGETYLDMISGWFQQGKQRVTGGFLECPLYTKDDVLHVDTQGGCCDNDVHEIWKCMEETVFQKAFLHLSQNGECLCYGCRLEHDKVVVNNEVRVLVVYSDEARVLEINGQQAACQEKELFLFSIEANEKRMGGARLA